MNDAFRWEVAYKKCAELAGGKPQCDIVINDLVNAGKLRQDNPSGYDRTEWLVIYDACQKEASWVRCVRTSTPSTTRDPKSLNRWSYNSAVFLERCREAIGKVRAEKKVEANEMPPQIGNGKRKFQMDKKLNVWLIEPDGTKKPMSCREVAEKYDSYKKGIIKQLRAGIDSGCDLSTVELD